MIGNRPTPAGASRLVSVVALALCLTPHPVLAQTASQITPPSLEPQTRRFGGSLVFSGQPGLVAPAGAESLSVTVASVSIEGGLPGMADAHDAVGARLVGRPVPASQIFQAAQELEAAYAREGYVLARIVLPAQTLVDGGPLRLVVVNGFVERTDLAHVPEPVRGRIDQVTRPLVGRKGLTLGEMERRLIIAGTTPGVALNSALAEGQQPGGTILAFDARYRPVTGFVGYDNTLSEELGDWSLSGGLELNAMLGLGEMIYLRAAGHPSGDFDDDVGSLLGEHPQMRSLAAGIIMPIGSDGLTFTGEVVQSNTTPEIANLQTASSFDRTSLRLRYPWLLTRAYDLGAEVILDIQSDDLDLIEGGADLGLYDDDLTVLRIATDGRRQLGSGAVIEGSLTASFGLDALGARTAEDADATLPLSRQGADAVFQKLEIAANYSQSVSEHLAFSVYGRAQTSFGEPLLVSEQMGIANFEELSTFDSGTLGGDSGWIVRGDVLSPWSVGSGALAFFSRVTPYAFAAMGELYLEEPTVFEQETLGVASLGIGVELISLIDPAYTNASLILEYGRAYRDDDEPDDNRFTLVGSFRF